MNPGDNKKEMTVAMMKKMRTPDIIEVIGDGVEEIQYRDRVIHEGKVPDGLRRSEDIEEPDN